MSGQLITETVLHVKMTNGNQGRGFKWYQSAKVREEMETYLRITGHVREPFDFPVHVNVTRILGKGERLWDSSSVGRGNYKELEDALVACNWFHDDCPKWITATDFRQDAEQREKGPAIKIEIFRA